MRGHVGAGRNGMPTRGRPAGGIDSGTPIPLISRQHDRHRIKGLRGVRKGRFRIPWHSELSGRVALSARCYRRVQHGGPASAYGVHGRYHELREPTMRAAAGALSVTPSLTATGRNCTLDGILGPDRAAGGRQWTTRPYWLNSMTGW